LPGVRPTWMNSPFLLVLTSYLRFMPSANSIVTLAPVHGLALSVDDAALHIAGRLRKRRGHEKENGGDREDRGEPASDDGA